MLERVADGSDSLPKNDMWRCSGRWKPPAIRQEFISVSDRIIAPAEGILRGIPIAVSL